MSLTARDTELLALSWQCFKEPPKLDYQKLADLGGFKTSASANAVFSVVKKKLINLSGANPAGASSTPKKTKAKSQPKPNVDENAEGLAKDDRAATLSIDHNGNEKAPSPSTPENGTVKPQTTAEDDDPTPTKATPKKRTPKPKVKTEVDAEGQAILITPTATPKKRVRATKPKGEAPTAPKRAKKANGKIAEIVKDEEDEGADQERFAATIAVSKVLQDSVFGNDEEVGDDHENDHVGVKETMEAKETMETKDKKEIAQGALELLAHQDGMFPDQDAVDDALFNQFTPSNEV